MRQRRFVLCPQSHATHGKSVQHGVPICPDGTIVDCCANLFNPFLVSPFIPTCGMPKNYRDNKRCRQPSKDNPPHDTTSWEKPAPPDRICCCTPQQPVNDSAPFPYFLWLSPPVWISLRPTTLPSMPRGTTGNSLNAANRRINGHFASPPFCRLRSNADCHYGDVMRRLTAKRASAPCGAGQLPLARFAADASAPV